MLRLHGRIKAKIHGYSLLSFHKSLIDVVLQIFQESPPNFHGPEFGLFFDIDGVLVRGRTVLPHTREAFRLLVDQEGNYNVPSIFCTNAGNVLRRKKAEQLSKWLGVSVSVYNNKMFELELKCYCQQFRHM